MLGVACAEDAPFMASYVSELIPLPFDSSLVKHGDSTELALCFFEALAGGQ